MYKIFVSLAKTTLQTTMRMMLMMAHMYIVLYILMEWDCLYYAACLLLFFVVVILCILAFELLFIYIWCTYMCVVDVCGFVEENASRITKFVSQRFEWNEWTQEEEREKKTINGFLNNTYQCTVQMYISSKTSVHSVQHTHTIHTPMDSHIHKCMRHVCFSLYSAILLWSRCR